MKSAGARDFEVPRPSSTKRLGVYCDDVALDQWLENQQDAVREKFATYVDEAFFFFDMLVNRPSVKRATTLLEVGGGIGLLSLLLAATGKRVVCVEPESAGFGGHGEIRQAFLQAWKGQYPDVTYLDGLLEDFPELGKDFECAIAIMVVEHVPDYPNLIRNVADHLNSGGEAHFIFTNYAFPYEPHFNIPTVFSKKLTEFFVASHLRGSWKGIENAQDFWDDLSWPTYRQVKRFLKNSILNYAFNRDAFISYTTRLGSRDFISRKGPLFQLMIPLAGLMRIAARSLPLAALPIIDVSVSSPGDGGRKRLVRASPLPVQPEGA